MTPPINTTVEVTTLYKRKLDADQTCRITHLLQQSPLFSRYPIQSEWVADQLRSVNLHREFLRSGWRLAQTEWRNRPYGQ